MARCLGQPSQINHLQHLVSNSGGQAKKWGLGQPLPRDVVWYPVPPAVVVQLGTPPAGYKYVRVAADILLITIGTSMVIDAIEDLARL